MKPTKKAFWDQNLTELRKSTQEFDRENIAESFGKPTAAAKKVLRRVAKHKPPRDDPRN